MDVKNKFQSLPKGPLTTDAKKNQDVYPKNLRKKEPTGANSFPRNEQYRKFNLQRAKDNVKRPRAKRQYHGSAEENSKVVASKCVEYGSVLAHGSKKENHLLNGNHLLNFHYEPRDAQSRNVGKLKRYNNDNRLLPSVQKHKYSKEQFLQASCQFVVTENGDYSPYFTDPDMLVNWKLIEQIKVYSSERLSCPICLYDPVAGKMTRCGHVYCWPCILHYMDISDKNGAYCKCPICYEFVHKDDLKSVIGIEQSTFNLGDTLNLRLMRREKASVFATPVMLETSAPVTFLSISENSNNQIYSKLLFANVKDIVDIIRLERDQLEHEFVKNPDCYVERTLEELLLRESNLLLQLKESKDVIPVENVTEKDKQTSRESEESADVCDQSNFKSSMEQSLKVANSASNNGQPTSIPSKFIYFYQAEDGQHLYLHVTNVKMLEMQYGGLEFCPPVITGKVLEKEAGSYTEDLKQRLRYLSHLPLTCQFELVEIELKPPLVSQEVLHCFRSQLITRQKRREYKERQEKQREKRITEEQNKWLGKYPTPSVNIESRHHFPQWVPELLFEDPSSHDLSIASSVASSPLSSSSFDDVTSSLQTDHSHEQQPQGPSFAEMLRTTRVKSVNTWPSVATAMQSKSVDTAVTASIEDDEEARYVSPPLKNQSLGEALARAFDQTRLLELGTRDDDNVAGKKKKKKKKKEKMTVLVATDLPRGS